MSNRTSVTPQLITEAPATVNSGSGFFSQYTPAALLSNTLYAQNTAAQLYTMNTLQLRADFKPLSARDVFSGISYVYKPAISACPNTTFSSISELSRLVGSGSFISRNQLGGILCDLPYRLTAVNSFSSEPRLAA